MSNILRFLWISLLAAFLVACGGNVQNNDPSPEPAVSEDATDVASSSSDTASNNDLNTEAVVGSTTTSEEEDSSYDSTERNEMNDLIANRVYFEYDSAFVSELYFNTLNQHIRFMRNYSDSILQLHGHADERGSQDYNLSLGENRGNSVKDVFITNGIDAERIRVISFGETRPIEDTHTEQAWSLNRRVDFLYE